MLPELVVLALEYYRAPLRYRHLADPRRPLPRQFSRLIGELGTALSPARQALTARALGISEGELEYAAKFFLRDVLLSASADHYRVLGLTPGSSPEAARQHYQLLVGIFHPDRSAGDSERDAVYTSRLNEAYNTLRQPEKRALYDQQIALTGSASAAEVDDRDFFRPLTTIDAFSGADADTGVRRFPRPLIAAAIVGVLAASALLVWLVRQTQQPTLRASVDLAHQAPPKPSYLAQPEPAATRPPVSLGQDRQASTTAEVEATPVQPSPTVRATIPESTQLASAEGSSREAMRAAAVRGQGDLLLAQVEASPPSAAAASFAGVADVPSTEAESAPPAPARPAPETATEVPPRGAEHEDTDAPVAEDVGRKAGSRDRVLASAPASDQPISRPAAPPAEPVDRPLPAASVAVPVEPKRADASPTARTSDPEPETKNQHLVATAEAVASPEPQRTPLSQPAQQPDGGRATAKELEQRSAPKPEPPPPRHAEPAKPDQPTPTRTPEKPAPARVSTPPPPAAPPAAETPQTAAPTRPAQEPAPDPQPKGPPPLSPQDIVDRLMQAYQAGDLDGFMRLFAADAQINGGRGTAHIRARYADMFSRLPERRLQVRGISWRKKGGSRIVGNGAIELKARQAPEADWGYASGSITIELVSAVGGYRIAKLLHRLD